MVHVFFLESSEDLHSLGSQVLWCLLTDADLRNTKCRRHADRRISLQDGPLQPPASQLESLEVVVVNWSRLSSLQTLLNCGGRNYEGCVFSGARRCQTAISSEVSTRLSATAIMALIMIVIVVMVIVIVIIIIITSIIIFTICIIMVIINNSCNTFFLATSRLPVHRQDQQ